MALPGNSLVEQMSQLDAARNLVLGDAALYPQIVHGILPIIGVNARLELRRWGAEFLTETFSSPAFPQQPKQKLATEILGAVNDLLNTPENDEAVVRGAIMTAASIYVLIFRQVVSDASQASLWQTMTTIKHTILKKWDVSSHGVKICCIKFAQKVVQVQTQGPIADPRRPEKNETSLAIVPRNHPLLAIPNIEAETSGLLDRLLNVFHENSSDPILVNATLNSIPVLIRTRPSISNKIINAILNFNPLKQANSPITPTTKVNIKSMERTTRALLLSIVKKAPTHPLAGRIQQYIERLAQSHNEIFDEASRKRALPAEPTDVVDSAKRARLGLETPPQHKIPPLPPGPTSFGQLFTLTEDVGLASFDVKQLPVDLVVKIIIPVLTRVGGESLDLAIGAVRSRYETICKKQVFERQNQAANAPPAADEDDDDYEPEYQPMDIPGPPTDIAKPEAPSTEGLPDIVSLGPFVLPRPPPLSPEDVEHLGKETVSRIFSMISTLPQSSKAIANNPSQSLGFGRLAASSSDRESWLTLLTRLATRSSAGLESEDSVDDQKEPGKQNIANTIRNMLYRYVLEDFRARMNFAISWMNEEWYNDQIQLKNASSQIEGDPKNPYVPIHYGRWSLKLLEGMLPYLDAKDKVLIRFLSELPELDSPLIQKVKTLANDPDRVSLCIQALHYLIIVRPPARQLCLDALVDLYQTMEETRPLATKILLKWKPEALPEQAKQVPSRDPRRNPNSANSTPVPQNGTTPTPQNSGTPIQTARTGITSS
ncbi:mRNA cleavage and polyadenylation specificity factor complex subunit [Trichophyton interdigitale]|uniref:mRNA cleavage and polyadenylation specificity factor complex subunit n=1 Tax=Trichophyton interdigitale TaxID=101480 RepID=A0A9P5CYS4_9EURO|nr:mRNA cleavage and polyadenylation specificity factor complex subunit [Trichophyton interdigitale]KAF3895215.1 mRNA cleavage and polyadenylation specificity factor complex subunit [Trichophyton interdigitale]KAG8209841.1 mRNA cleavage and polyadenylation specificity factor complex subunit [Trichophyton interdigitale]